VYRQVGNKNKAPLSKMKLKNKLATWAIIEKNTVGGVAGRASDGGRGAGVQSCAYA
jgi:hypothetical protein